MADRKPYQVCVVTGTRAEYGLLRQLLFKLHANQEFSVKLVVTGAHLSQAYGNTQDEIRSDGFLDYIAIPIPMEDDSKAGMAVSTGVALAKFAELFREYRPDVMIVLGDRFEIFAAVSAAHLCGVPVAHLSGGDVTEGAVDDAIRNSVTKMSSLHFPGCEESARRIIQMGEHPSTVFDVGEPGVENCRNIQLISREELADNLNFSGVKENYSVVTFHPVTMEENTAEKQLYALIQAMDAFADMHYIITMANADAGGRAINGIWLKEGAKRKNWLVVQSLGVLRYLSAVKYAKLVIGNSSSGIYEAPALGTPTINIGDRQKGRMMAESVICCEPEQSAIENSMDAALGDAFQTAALHVKSPFGDGTTSDQIVNILLDYLKNRADTTQKRFYDIEFTV